MSFFLTSLKYNWKSGLTVALVTLPLATALAIASGSTPDKAIITSFWAGLIASLLGGSEFNIVGVAGALTTILLAFSLNFSPTFLPLVAILVGLVILAVWFFDLQKYLIYIPSSVMYGFAAGVAVQIAITQLNDALGLVLPKKPEILESLTQTFEHFGDLKITSLVAFLLAVCALILFKKIKFFLPGILPVSLVGVLIGIYQETLGTGWGLVTLEQKLKQPIQVTFFQLSDFASFPSFFSNFQQLTSLLNITLIVALIASLETLITAKIAQKITKTKFNEKKEMLALGLANVISGLMGGLPATGVFIRTGLNIKTGAKNRSSGILSTFFVAFLAIFFLPYFKYIPMAFIAAILFNTAIGLIEVHKFKYLFKNDVKNFWVGIIVAVTTVLFDPSIGVLVGTVLALLFFVDKLSKGEFEVNFNHNHSIVEGYHGVDFKIPDYPVDVLVYTIEGVLAYLDAPAHAQNFQKMYQIKRLKTVIIRLRDLIYLDIDGVEMLDEVITGLQATGIQVLLTKPFGVVFSDLLKSEAVIELGRKNLIFDKTSFALEYLGYSKEEVGLDKSRCLNNVLDS